MLVPQVSIQHSVPTHDNVVNNTQAVQKIPKICKSQKLDC